MARLHDRTRARRRVSPFLPQVLAALALVAGCSRRHAEQPLPAQEAPAGIARAESTTTLAWRADSLRDGRVTHRGRPDVIHVRTPGAGETVTSPLVVRGEARAEWFYDKNFRVALEDETGHVLGLAIAHALEPWQPSRPVRFEAVLGFSQPAVPRGFVVLQAANPSDEPARGDSIRVAVRFRPASP